MSPGTNLSDEPIFDREVAPLLEAGHRVAYLLIDSLHYELAVELEKQLSETRDGGAYGTAHGTGCQSKSDWISSQVKDPAQASSSPSTP